MKLVLVIGLKVWWCFHVTAVANLCYRNWGTDCLEAHPPTWLYREYTGEYQQREVILIFNFKLSFFIGCMCFMYFKWSMVQIHLMCEVIFVKNHKNLDKTNHMIIQLLPIACTVVLNLFSFVFSDWTVTCLG